MGNCGSSLNCTQCYSPSGEDGCLSQLEVDPDIAGTGILTAFFLAAAIIFLTALYAYFSRSLPDSNFSATDDAVTLRYEQSTFGKKLAQLFDHVEVIVYRGYQHCLFRTSPISRSPMPRSQRIKAVAKFLLAFGDQQLATGLAILIATLASQCRMTLYELRIASVLAWFSALSHLTTLMFQQEYFFDHKAVRNWRVVGMSLFLILLVYVRVLLIVSDSREDINFASPVACLYHEGSGRSATSNSISIWDIYTLLWVVYIYGLNIPQLFFDPREDEGSLTGWIAARRTIGDSGLNAFKNEFRALKKCAALQHRLLISPNPIAGLIRQRQNLSAYRRSSLCNLATIYNFFVVGLGNAIAKTRLDDIRTTSGVHRMGFGQVVALALLVMPFLAVTEIYSEARGTHSDLLDEENALSTYRSRGPNRSDIMRRPLVAELRSMLIPSPLDERKDDIYTYMNEDLSVQLGYDTLPPLYQDICAFGLFIFVANELNRAGKSQSSRNLQMQSLRLKDRVRYVRLVVLFEVILYTVFMIADLISSSFLTMIGSCLLMYFYFAMFSSWVQEIALRKGLLRNLQQILSGIDHCKDEENTTT